MKTRIPALMIAIIGMAAMSPTRGATPEFVIEIKDHLFYPSELTIPSGVKIKLRIVNNDATAEEFESYELNREKVIRGGRSGTVFIGPLPAGEYPFFGEFYPKTAQGKILVVDEI
ncbi:MAG: cupredoxin domain-containing protein [Pseudomonadales bacterium]|nr:cupredoxin domain-containing protein [Pseudomonadales bacterium]MCP5345733.1 cupredoxin domain-containing protein [Pseudomonadales bacterium]